MPFGPFTLQWRAPSPNPPNGTPLPQGIERTYISTPSGPLELLSAIPDAQTSHSNLPTLFFQHGGFGCAQVWLDYMLYFSTRGYPCYAISLRGHGKSWYPSFWRMYFSSRGVMADDLVRGVKWVESAERKRRGLKEGEEEEAARVVLIAHSAGGALSQYVLSRGLVLVRGFCMCAAVPGFGSFSVYRFWALTAPIHFPYRLFHPRYILATTTQVHEAFFTPETPVPVVKRLEALLAPYETMLWPLQCLFRFVSGPDVLKSIVGWQKSGNEPKDRVSRIFVLAAEHDVLCTPEVSRDAALRYRVASRQLRSGGGQGLKPTCSPSSYPLMLTSGEDIHDENVSLDVGKVGKEGSKSDRDGVRFSVVSGLGHHLQNHVEWEKGAGEIEDWVKGL